MNRILCLSFCALAISLTTGAEDVRPKPITPTVLEGKENGVSTVDPSALIGNKDPLYLLELAEVHYRFAAYDLAKPMLDACVARDKNPTNLVRAYMLLGSLKSRKGDWQGAIEIYENARTKLGPSIDTAKLDMWLVDAYRHEKMYESAQNTLNAIIDSSEQKRDKNSYAQISGTRLVEIWQEQFGDLDKFLDKKANSFAVTEENGKLLETIGDIYRRYRRDDTRTWVFYERALKVRPHDIAFIEKTCRFLELIGRPQNAVELYDGLLLQAKAPETIKFYLIERAGLLLKLSKKDEALASLSENFKPVTSFDYALLAGFYEEAGMETESEITQDKGNKLAASNDDIGRNKLYLANRALFRKDFKRAEEITRGVLADIKDSPQTTNKALGILSRIEHERFMASREQK